MDGQHYAYKITFKSVSGALEKIVGDYSKEDTEYIDVDDSGSIIVSGENVAKATKGFERYGGGIRKIECLGIFYANDPNKMTE